MTESKHKVPPLRFVPVGMAESKHKVPPLRFVPVGMTDLCREFAGQDTRSSFVSFEPIPRCANRQLAGVTSRLRSLTRALVDFGWIDSITTPGLPLSNPFTVLFRFLIAIKVPCNSSVLTCAAPRTRF